MNVVSIMFCLLFWNSNVLYRFSLHEMWYSILFDILNVVFNLFFQLIITVINISIVRSWFLSDVSWLIIWTLHIKIYITVIVHNYKIIVYTCLSFCSHISGCQQTSGVCSGGIIVSLSCIFLTGGTTGVLDHIET